LLMRLRLLLKRQQKPESRRFKMQEMQLIRSGMLLKPRLRNLEKRQLRKLWKIRMPLKKLN